MCLLTLATPKSHKIDSQIRRNQARKMGILRIFAKTAKKNPFRGLTAFRRFSRWQYKATWNGLLSNGVGKKGRGKDERNSNKQIASLAETEVKKRKLRQFVSCIGG